MKILIAMLMAFGMVIGTAGCLRWGTSAPAQVQMEAKDDCVRQCDGAGSGPCQYNDKACMKDRAHCISQCERYYGYRPGLGRN